MFHGLVLCVGPEGHTAVEWFAADDCQGAPAGAAAFAADRCCDCTDARLLQPFGDKRDGDPLVGAAEPVRPLPLPPRGNACPHGAISRVFVPPDELTGRRQIVLQI